GVSPTPHPGRGRAKAPPHRARRGLRSQGGRVKPLSLRARLTLWYAGVLVAILVVVSALSYSVLRWSLLQQVDASLAAVAQIVRETDERGAGGSEVERAIRELLVPCFSDQFFQFLDPEGRSRFRSGAPHPGSLPLSLEARLNAAHGRQTIETLEDPANGPLRVLTVPVLRAGRSVEIIQVAAPLARTREALSRYLTTLLALVPVAVGLAAAGGAVIASRALQPVREMSRAARQITAEDLGRRLSRRGADDEIDHLADTLNAMLEGLEAPFPQPLLLEVLETGARRAQGVGVTMRADTFEPATVLGDAGALRRAILNLVDNAIKYTPAGGKVELSLVTASGQALVTVRDTGIGFEPGAAARIFEPFVRLDAARGRDTGGTGLGRAVVRSVVTGHGGAVEGERAPGAGSRFTIRLPLTSSK